MTLTELEETLTPLLRRTLSDVLQAEGLVTEAMRDLVKDEIKEYMRAKLSEDKELKKEIKDALGMYMEARARELIAAVRLTKAGAKLSFDMVPDHLREELKGELVRMFEKELSELLERV
jgi:DNA-binding FrmR family transcriptional regulator